MPVQDRTGDDYEQILAASLVHLGYSHEQDVGKNYLHPSKRSKRIIIDNTYIQPDLVVRENEAIRSVIYVTHWSNARSSKYKFWRTWEELAQQKVSIENRFTSINCIFEALPEEESPEIYIYAKELPEDENREGNLPLQLNGWDPGIGWAMLETFDISIIFPVGYKPVFLLDYSKEDVHDAKTSDLLSEALRKKEKTFFVSQWETLKQIQKESGQLTLSLYDTHNRYRIGLLHVYLFYRLTQRVAGERAPTIESFVSSLLESSTDRVQINKLASRPAFLSMGIDRLIQIFTQLSEIYVRTGKNARTFCTLSSFSNPIAREKIYKAKLNQDFVVCLKDLKIHVDEKGFSEAIYRSFSRFDQLYGVNEALDDLSSKHLIESKENFVRKEFCSCLEDEERLYVKLYNHAEKISEARLKVSNHRQNWVLEMLLYMTGLSSAEDIQKRFKIHFDVTGHKLRTHAPYGGYATTITFLLQGRDLCEHWGENLGKKTLTKTEFRQLCWQVMAKCILEGFQDKNAEIKSSEVVIKKYAESKAMRIISSDLNGFYIMIEHYIGDICFLQFTDDSKNYKKELSARIRPSWQTDLINALWGGRPLETWFEGVSKNGQWLIKIQSAQDGHESDKTKEVAGRCRALRISWSHDSSISSQSEWKFSKRELPKLALILDGDWDKTKKRNLYEAGWNWVGDVSQLSELRRLIQDEP